ncbi:hypothetical protein D7322_22005 [Sphingobacterium puteale]|uniref:Uncharacterized protein n=1 Tax=Sphingobacterium puteale TaxID=2420510 RepID=A0A420VST0_9SPHI|nr:hypothetical protein D7322_22005 [Sphingobacterium puteale]
MGVKYGGDNLRWVHCPKDAQRQIDGSAGQFAVVAIRSDNPRILTQQFLLRGHFNPYTNEATFFSNVVFSLCNLYFI